MSMILQGALDFPLQVSARCSKVAIILILVKHLTCIEFSYKGTVIFVAGGDLQTRSKDEYATHTDLESVGSVAAVKFSSNMKLIVEYKLKGSLSSVHCLKRHEQGNILFAGLTSKVVVVFFDGTSFETLSEYSDLDCGPITCMQLMQEDLYCLGSTSPKLLKLSYTNLGNSLPIPLEKPKLDKSVSAQFTVASKKAQALNSRVTGFDLSNSRNIVCSEGKVYLRNGQGVEEPSDRSQLIGEGRACALVKGEKVLVVDHGKLTLLDKSGQCIAEMENSSSEGEMQDFQLPVISGIRYSPDEDISVYAWAVSSGVLGIFDLEKIEFDQIPISNPKLRFHPSYVHICENGTKFLCVSSCQKSSEENLTFWQKSGLMIPTTRQIKYFSEKISKVLAVESNSDSSVFLMVVKLKDKGYALIAGSFDGYFDSITSLEKFDSTEIYGIKRVLKSDFFLVGGTGKIHVVLFHSRSVFVEIATIKELKIGVLLSLEMVNSNTLCLLEKQGGKIAIVSFTKSLQNLAF
jgi:hypothetical protein